MATTAQGGPKSTGVRMIFGMENANYKGRETASAGAIGNAASAGSIYSSLTATTPPQSTDNEPLFVLEDLDWEDAPKSWPRGELGGTKIAVLQTEEDTPEEENTIIMGYGPDGDGGASPSLAMRASAVGMKTSGGEWADTNNTRDWPVFDKAFGGRDNWQDFLKTEERNWYTEHGDYGDHAHAVDSINEVYDNLSARIENEGNIGRDREYVKVTRDDGSVFALEIEEDGWEASVYSNDDMNPDDAMEGYGSDNRQDIKTYLDDFAEYR